ncbi:MAG: BatA domain-containing protein [Planctomycetales bacterium]|nr:BatA domain-containing protein [Planctomycetales bacterium]
MQFIHQSLTWGFLLIALPLLIHLINLMRHQRVQWAAMEFLLASYRKHRRWVWLKQLLLLLARMLAVACLVAMLAKLVTRDQWTSWFGSQTIHHFIVIDDSLSMADRTGNGTAFSRARRAIARLASTARHSERPQQITLIRSSRAAVAADTAESANSWIDLNDVPLTDEIAQAWQEDNSPLQVTQFAVPLTPALKLVEQLASSSDAQQRVLHVLSDFRAHDWEQPGELRERLSKLSKLGVDLQLVRCVDSSAPNLAVTRLVPEMGTRAAGVPLMMSVAVKNLGDTSVQQLRLKLRTTIHPRSPQGTESAAQTSELPDLLIDRVDAGETTVRQFQVFFTSPGEHEVEVELPSDSLEADNRRWCVVSLEGGESALVIDNSEAEKSAYYLEAVFRPGTKARTGIVPSVQPSSYLRDTSVEELLKYQAIYLLDVAPLETTSLDNLRAYVERGGGVACFVGPNFNRPFYDNWFQTGLFPIRLERAIPLAVRAQDVDADVQFQDHPIFHALTGQRNPFASSVRIQKYVAAARDWSPSTDDGVRVLAQLRDGAPLVVERQLGGGRVVCFLTTLAPDWNNWAMEPSFIVTALQLHAHLAQGQRQHPDQRVGETIRVDYDPAKFQPDVQFQTPGATPELLHEVQKEAAATGASQERLSVELNPQTLTIDGVAETAYSGVYDASLTSRDGKTLHRRYALNVDPTESDLTTLEAKQLRTSLDPVNVRVVDVEAELDSGDDFARNSWSEWLLGILIVLLLIEQWLAYVLSYHPHASRSAGGATQ